MADQLTPFMLNAYESSPVITPNIDALAARGARFDAAYTPSPICVTARAAMMTGLYPSRLGCYDNGDSFPALTPTFAHHLTNAGYDTTLSGKMHFVGQDQLHGFRKRLTTDVYPSSYDWSYDPIDGGDELHESSPTVHRPDTVLGSLRRSRYSASRPATRPRRVIHLDGPSPHPLVWTRPPQCLYRSQHADGATRLLRPH